MNVSGSFWLVNIGSGNGLVPSGNNPLPEPMLTHIYVAIWQIDLNVGHLDLGLIVPCHYLNQ